MFERQVDTLVKRGYPELAGLTPAAFRKQVKPLKSLVVDQRAEEGRLPFAVVVKSDLVSPGDAIDRVVRQGRVGFSVLDDDELRSFEPIDEVTLPAGSVYLVTDVDTGRDTLNVTPDDALEQICGRGRSPLTIDEGIAVVTHHPEAVAKNNGFSLLASRCGDRRVTAMWISQNRPKLGWCWAANPHTWLGSASCAGRIGV